MYRFVWSAAAAATLVAGSMAAGSVDGIATAPPPSTGDDAADGFAAAAAIAEDFVAERGLDGAGLVVIDRDAGIVYEGYFGEFEADRVSLIASSSKMLTAGVLLRLQDDGLLDLDAPVADYLDWEGNPDITVAQMLSHSSGLVGLGPDPTYAPYLCQFVGADLTTCAETIFETPDDDADTVAPDTEFRYGGGQWQVAGGVAESVSGKSWAELVDEIYVQPCGVESLGYTNHWATYGTAYPEDFDVAALVPTDNPHMEGGVYITAPDYAELMLMHLRDGECPNGTVLSPEALAFAHGDRIGEVWGGDTGSPPTVGAGYGLGWFVDETSGRITDPGAYGSFPWLDLDGGFGAYLVVEADSVTGAELAAQLFEPVESAVLAGR